MKRLIFILFVLLPLGAIAGDRYKEVATFEAGRATLAVRLEFRADGDKRGLVRMDAAGFGGILIFAAKEWDALTKNFGDAIAAAGKMTGEESRKFGEVESRAGGFLRVEALSRGGKPMLRLTRRDPPGSKYPDVVFEMAAGEFPRLQQALDEVAKELARK